MYTVTREIGIDCGHRVPFHDSKCRHIHGHRYRIQATFSATRTIAYSSESSSAGMLVDFGHIKTAMMESIHDPYDHKLILWEDDHILKHLKMIEGAVRDSIVPVPVIPTAEELARFWYRVMRDYLNTTSMDIAPGLVFEGLKVWETPNSFATFQPKYSDA